MLLKYRTIFAGRLI